MTSELALGGYAASQTFGYSVTHLEQSQVYLVGACIEVPLIGPGGVELQAASVGELTRFFVYPG